MPGLRLTRQQARRFLGLDEETSGRVLEVLVDTQFLVRTADGQYAMAAATAPPRVGVKTRMARADLGAKPAARRAM